MKKYSIIISVLLLIVVAILLAQMWGKTSPAPALVEDQTTVKPGTTVTPTPGGTTGGAKPAAKPTGTTGGTVTAPKPQPTGTFIDEIKLRAELTERCNKAAGTQYTQLYANTYTGVSYAGYINKSMTGCYMKVSGSTYGSYTTKPVSVLIFRDVYQNRLLADCTNTDQTTPSWQCVNRTTGQPIPRQQYDDMISGYLLQ